MDNFNLIWLDCSINVLTLLPNKLQYLKYLNFSNNQIINLDLDSYCQLKYLIGFSNKIKQITNLPSTLIYLDLFNNPINNFDNIIWKNPDQNILEYLLISKTKINSINLANFKMLKYLDISAN